MMSNESRTEKTHPLGGEVWPFERAKRTSVKTLVMDSSPSHMSKTLQTAAKDNSLTTNREEAKQSIEDGVSNSTYYVGCRAYTRYLY